MTADSPGSWDARPVAVLVPDVKAVWSTGQVRHQRGRERPRG